jgi:hypothetical protein
MGEARTEEREAFAASFLSLGPEAPTILPGWEKKNKKKKQK